MSNTAAQRGYDVTFLRLIINFAAQRDDANATRLPARQVTERPSRPRLGLSETGSSFCSKELYAVDKLGIFFFLRYT